MSAWLDKFGTLGDWCSPCPFCGGKEFEQIAKGDVVDTVMQELWQDSSTIRCACWRLYITMARLWEMEFPRSYVQYNWDSSWPYRRDESNQGKFQKWDELHQDSYSWGFSHEDEEVIRFWVDYPEAIANKGLSLVLHGKKGRGKTSLATVLAKEMTKRVGIDSTGFIGTFEPRFLVCDELYEYISTKDWKGKELSNKAMRSSVLVLDDLRFSNSGYASTELIERLHSFLQYRAGCSLPTIITTNKISASKDYESNGITDFLGITSYGAPQKFGK